ncbi:MAG: magnesium transporter [Planctomycetes bacterium]|nr:magnesium transporter [Planctomycetota bacterium]
MGESTEKYREEAETIRGLLERGDSRSLVRAVRDMHPADLAEMLDEFEPHEKALLFEAMSVEAAAEMLDEADQQSQQEIIAESEYDRVIKVLEELPPDEAADLLAAVAQEDASKLLGRMEPEIAEQVEQLLEYPEDSAGGVMTTEVVKLQKEMTVAEAIRETQRGSASEGVQWPYVVDSGEKLVGYVPLHKLVFGRPDAKIREIMDDNVISVTADTDQEEVGNLVRRYDLDALPVVDKANKLLGVVTVDDVIEAIEDEVSEDMYRMAGTGERDPLHASLPRKVWLRLPWLILTLIGGLIISTVVSSFQGSISKVVALASFLPIIPLLGGNVAIQAATIVVRGIALGDITRGKILRLIVREFAVGIMLGAFCGVTAGLMAALLYGQIAFSCVITTAVFIAVVVAVINGTVIPLVFNSIGIDPALAAGPFVTILNDVTSITTYLTLATLLLNKLT